MNEQVSDSAVPDKSPAARTALVVEGRFFDCPEGLVVAADCLGESYSTVIGGQALTITVPSVPSDATDNLPLLRSPQLVSTRRRQPSEERRSPRPDRVVAFPLTFNTANKIARGIMDNQVTGTLCDALGTSAPIVAALMVSIRLWGHPAWEETVRELVAAGVVFLDPQTGEVGEPRPVQSGSGPQIVEGFDPAWVVSAVRSLPTSSA